MSSHRRLAEISDKIKESAIIDEENAEFEFLNNSEIVDKVLNSTADDEVTYTMDSSLPEDDSVNISGPVDAEDDIPRVSEESALNAVDLMIRYSEENGWSLNSQFSLRETRSKIFERIVDGNSI